MTLHVTVKVFQDVSPCACKNVMKTIAYTMPKEEEDDLLVT
jgi:hypothetical protein